MEEAAAGRRRDKGITAESTGTPYHRRGHLVRALRGCLDRLPRMQRNALVLRYGIGKVRPRSAPRAARELSVSRNRFRLIERRGVRSLVMAGRRSSCERTGIQESTITAVEGLVSNQPAASEFTLASAGDAALLQASLPTGGVAGVRESGGSDPQKPAEDQGGGSPNAGPVLPTPFGDVTAGVDNPLFILFLLLALAATAVAGRVIARTLR